MHYYPHHIGDFISDTARLTDSQCMAYLRLIWHYYDTEKPLQNDSESLAFIIGASVGDVNLILKHYFVLDGDFWRKTRCDSVIAEYHGKADKARKSADARWKKAKEKQSESEGNANASPEDANESKSNANQKPRTNNQEPIEDIKNNTPQAALGLIGLDDSTTDKQKKHDYPEWFENIWAAYPDRSGGDNKRKALQGANARIKAGSTHDDLLTAVNRYRVYIIATGRMGTEYVKQAATFFGSVDNITNQWLPPAGPPIKPGTTAANLNFTAKDYDNGISPDGSF